MESWLAELDMLGFDAPLHVLEHHLHVAPDGEHPDVAFLAGFLAAMRVRAHDHFARRIRQG